MSLVYATFKLNSATSPRNIDLAVSKKAKDKLWLGIYELDGDNLRLCLPEVAPFDQRPTEFKAGKGSNLKVLKLKRNDDVVKEELKRLAGTWRAVAVELGGKEPDVEIGPNNLLVISGTKLSFVTGEKKRTIECTFTIDPTKKPMWIDVTRTSDKVTWHGIYELEGDKLKLFQSTPGKRPTEFKTKEGTQEVIHTHERVKEAKEPEAPAGQDLRDQTALAEKQATIKRAAVKVVEAQNAKAQARLSTIKAQVTQAKAAESLAEMQVERFKKLFDERSIEENAGCGSRKSGCHRTSQDFAG
jgi:uncharacterized protein (TIGR03067 family)